MKAADEIIRFLNEDGSWEVIRLDKVKRTPEALELENQRLRAENMALKESLKLIA